jgi:hypothetical protein
MSSTTFAREWFSLKVNRRVGRSVRCLVQVDAVQVQALEILHGRCHVVASLHFLDCDLTISLKRRKITLQSNDTVWRLTAASSTAASRWHSCFQAHLDAAPNTLLSSNTAQLNVKPEGQMLRGKVAHDLEPVFTTLAIFVSSTFTGTPPYDLHLLTLHST